MEIDLELPFDAEQLSLLDMHSVLNVLTVIQFELMHLEEMLGGNRDLEILRDEAAGLGDCLTNHDHALEHLQAIERYSENVSDMVTSPQVTDRLDGVEEYHEIVANLAGIFTILSVRAKEILDRSEHPGKWMDHHVETLKQNFTEVFQAIEKNSKGAYHIVNNLAAHEKGDYLIHFHIHANGKDSITMPPVLQDVMRDLLANARKYTVPGGVITAGLLETNEEVRFVVQDTGCGIPPEEIEQVVHFGVRGSNVQQRPTRGGGFGLTKAYHMVKMFGGRMWIDSPCGEGGTRIELRLPRPSGTQQPPAYGN